MSKCITGCGHEWYHQKEMLDSQKLEPSSLRTYKTEHIYIPWWKLQDKWHLLVCIAKTRQLKSLKISTKICWLPLGFRFAEVFVIAFKAHYVLWRGTVISLFLWGPRRIPRFFKLEVEGFIFPSDESPSRTGLPSKAHCQGLMLSSLKWQSLYLEATPTF